MINAEIPCEPLVRNATFANRPIRLLSNLRTPVYPGLFSIFVASFVRLVKCRAFAVIGACLSVAKAAGARGRVSPASQLETGAHFNTIQLTLRHSLSTNNFFISFRRQRGETCMKERERERETPEYSSKRRRNRSGTERQRALARAHNADTMRPGSPDELLNENPRF